jgi:hypothetical protein
MGRRSGLNWIETAYGRKDGDSPTAGKAASTYRVRFADGSSVEKRVFHAIQPQAIAYVYEHDGKWYCAGVYDAPAEKMKRYESVPAERVR